LEAAADPLPIPKPTAISQRSLGSSGVRKASHTVPVSPCHPPEYTTWSTVDTRPLRSQPPAQRRLRFSTSCSWPYPDLRLAFPGPLVTELDTAAPLLESTGKWAEIVARRRAPGPTGPTTSLTRNRIPVAGYLLDSGDRKILWLRTARFAWRHGTPSRLVARKASGALPTGAGDCRRYRGAARRPLGADKLLRAF